MTNLSNQSAIAKQGLALRNVIIYVMQLTGRDKVILMGHSMGGLAAREYLQNPSNWVDTNGKKIKNWKQKAINVWFTEENKSNGSSKNELVPPSHKVLPNV